MATRIDQLGPGDRALLRWASVLGVSFSGSLIEEVLEDDAEVGAASEAWERLGEFVERDPDVPGAFRFRHALIRDAAYEGLSYKRRRELHGRVADVIERRQGERPEEAAELLSLHYFNAGRWNEAWTYSRAAGDQARKVYANADAARFYERATEAGTKAEGIPDHELAAVWRSLGVVREATGDFEGALEALRAAIRLLKDDPEAQAGAYQVRALSLLRLGNYAGALKETTSGLKLVEASSSETGAAISARLTAIRADIRLQQGQAREAIRLAEAAVEAAERTEARDALARAYSALDRAYQQLGEPSKAVFERQAVEIYREIGELRSAALVEMNLGVQAFAEGRWDEAVERYASADRELQRVGDAASAAMVSANLGEILISRGELDRAKTLLEEARETLRASGLAAPAVFVDTQLARLELEEGRLDEASESLRATIEEAVALQHPYLVVDASFYLALAHRRGGELEKALEVLDEADSVGGDEVIELEARIGLVRAGVLADTGDVVQAESVLQSALALARDQSQLWELAQIMLARADVAQQAGREVSPEELEEARGLLQLFGTSPGASDSTSAS